MRSVYDRRFLMFGVASTPLKPEPPLFHNAIVQYHHRPRQTARSARSPHPSNAMHRIANPTSQTRLPQGLERQDQHQHGREQEQRAADVHGRRGLQVGVDGDDGGEDAEDAVRHRGQGVAGAAVFGREDLGGVCVSKDFREREREGAGLGGCGTYRTA